MFHGKHVSHLTYIGKDDMTRVDVSDSIAFLRYTMYGIITKMERLTHHVWSGLKQHDHGVSEKTQTIIKKMRKADPSDKAMRTSYTTLLLIVKTLPTTAKGFGNGDDYGTSALTMVLGTLLSLSDTRRTVGDTMFVGDIVTIDRFLHGIS